MAKDVIGEDANQSYEFKSGWNLLLRNLCFEKGELKWWKFSQRTCLWFKFISMMFRVCHRAHSSVEAITTWWNTHKGAGFLSIKEIDFGKQSYQTSSTSFVAVIEVQR